MTETIEYMLKPQGKVLQEYADCRSRVSIIRGPLGSGKTVQTMIKILELICEQAPITNKSYKNYNCRPSRWLAVRNTYSELFSTTIKDWLEAHGDLGPFKQGSKEPPIQKLHFDLEDGTQVRSEIIFVAFDRPEHVKKARGMQPTGIWLNETKELSKTVVDMLDLRHGRYPSKKEGVTPSWHGMIGDTNSPDEDHWLYEIAEETKPLSWAFHHQPGGVYKVGDKWEVNPLAENLSNLPENYYLLGMEGKTNDWIKVNLANEYGFVSSGKPVHPWYVDSVHCLSIDYKPKVSQPIVMGFDFGRTPACTFLQREEAFNRWVAFDEFLAVDMSATSFAPELKKYIDKTYKGYKFRGWGDPAGDKKGEAVDDTPMKILRAAGIPCNPTPSNVTAKRRLALETPMKELCMDGKPRFLLTPKAKMLRKGLQGGFCYKRIHVSDERYSEEPDKNEYSHIVESCEYGLQGEKEGREALIRQPTTHNTAQAPIAPVDFNVFA